MVGAGGLVVSIITFAVGAILNWGMTVSPYQHGFNVNKVGQILMLIGVVGALLSLVVMLVGNTRRRHTIIDDSHGNVIRRIDSSY
jgi:beta-lactamase regulating signal transducer with metallopeptidase domain